jgi:hypothetical protein
MHSLSTTRRLVGTFAMAGEVTTNNQQTWIGSMSSALSSSSGATWHQGDASAVLAG